MSTITAIVAFIVAAKDRKGSSLPAIKAGLPKSAPRKCDIRRVTPRRAG